MSLQNDSREHPDERKVRYAVVGAGWISQEDFMPGVEHTGNSEMSALVTGDRTKAKALAKRYAIPRLYDYDDYEKMLESGEVDAVYNRSGGSRWKLAKQENSGQILLCVVANHSFVRERPLGPK